MAGFNLFNSGGNGMDSLDLSGALERKKANPGGGLTGNVPFQSRYHVDDSNAVLAGVVPGQMASLEGGGASPGAPVPWKTMYTVDNSDAGDQFFSRPAWMDAMGVHGNIADKYSFFGWAPANPPPAKPFGGLEAMKGDPAYWLWNMQAGQGHNEQGPAEGGNWVYDAPKEIVRFGNNPLAAAAVQGKWSLLNGTQYDVLDALTGKVTGQRTFEGLKDSDNMDLAVAMLVGGALGGMGLTAANAGVGTTGLSSYGGAATGYGSTALPASVTSGAAAVGGGAGAGAAGGFAGDSTAAGYGGLDAASTSTMGGGASVNGGNVLGSLGGATGVTEPVASAVGTGATTGSSGLTGGLSDLVTKLGGANLGTLKKAYTAYQLYNALTGGKGGGTTGSTMGNTNSNGFSMNDLFGLIGGGMDAYNQNKAADTMRQWLDSNQAKMEGFMNPNSPEYSALWERMSRKDAAAGRNSQYGPRTADFAAQVAQAKANNILNFTTGNSRAYSNALNQKASSFAGLNAALQNAFGKNGGGSMNLSSIIKALTDGSGELSNEDFFKMIGDEGMPIDYGAGSDDPTEEDVLDFMNRWGEL